MEEPRLLSLPPCKAKDRSSRHSRHSSRRLGCALEREMGTERGNTGKEKSDLLCQHGILVFGQQKEIAEAA